MKLVLRLVRDDSPWTLKRRAGDLAEHANYEMRVPWGIYHPAEHGPDNPTVVVLASVRGADVGMAVIRADGERWRVDLVWVRREFRQAGVAVRMLRYAARRLGVRPRDFTWLAPLSPGGRRLVLRLAKRPWLREFTTVRVPLAKAGGAS